MLLIPFYVIANLHKSRIYIGKSTK